MKKLSSPWRSHYITVEMITPVTALIRNQKSGAYNTVHTRGIPRKNTRKRILHRRKQPDRRVKHIQNTVRMEDVWNDEY